MMASIDAGSSVILVEIGAVREQAVHVVDGNTATARVFCL